MTRGAGIGRWWSRGRLGAVLPCAALLWIVSAASASPIVVNQGAPVVAAPDVILTLVPPPSARTVEVAFDEAFAATLAFPVADRIGVRLPTTAPEERRYLIRARYRDGAGDLIPGDPDSGEVMLDTLAPRLVAAAVDQRAPVLACRSGGPTVAGTSRAAVAFRLRAQLDEAGAGGAEYLLADPAAVLADWRATGRSARFTAAERSTVHLQTRDAAGNVSTPVPVPLPAAAVTPLRDHTHPFSFAVNCRRISPTGWNGAIRRRPRAPAPALGTVRLVRVPPSRLAWTAYPGRPPALNWVHAATELKARLKARRMGDYRAAVAEIIALSRVDRDSRGRPFRLNENHFTNPYDGRRPPWRDAMGTGVLLASLLPALPGDAPVFERDAARRVAAEYLTTFDVDRRDGGVVWRDRGPGTWFLEATYMTEARILNGFMQSVVSLDRFAKQADRLSRLPEWRALRDRARRHVQDAARSLAYWLPAYDLGGGATRYHLTSGPANPKYRLFHQVLLGQLAQIDYLPRAARATFMAYRVRWGGSAEPLR